MLFAMMDYGAMAKRFATELQDALLEFRLTAAMASAALLIIATNIPIAAEKASLMTHGAMTGCGAMEKKPAIKI